MQKKKGRILILRLLFFIILPAILFFLLSCSAGVDIGAVDKVLSAFGLQWPAGFEYTCLSNEELNVLITARDQNGSLFNWSGTVNLISTNPNVSVNPSSVVVQSGSVQRGITLENSTIDINETFIKLSYSDVVTLIEGAILVEGNAIPAPDNVTASDGLHGDKIVVQWDSVAEADEYGVYRAELQAGPYTKIRQLDATSYDDIGASRGIEYFYKTRAYSSVQGDSGYSDADSGYRDGLDTTTGVTATVDDHYDKVVVGWDAVTGTETYHVYRADSEPGTYSEIGDTAAVSFEDITTAAGITFYYKVLASGLPFGDGTLSDFTAGQRKLLPPPGDIHAYDGAALDRVVIKWDEVPDAELYNIYKSESESGEYTFLDSTAFTDYEDTDVEGGTTYWYKIKTYLDIYDESEFSDPDSGETWNYIFRNKFGSWGTETGQFKRPRGIAVDKDGNIYIGDTSNDRVQKFDKYGNYLKEWGSTGSVDGQFIYPTEIAVDKDSYVYVIDASNHRIQKFNSNGAHQVSWGSEGSGDGQFESPTGIAVDLSSNVYVGDNINHRVQKFDSGGNFILKWGDRDTSGYIRSVAVDSTGNVYALCSSISSGTVRIFESDGTAITNWSTISRQPDGIAVDLLGNVYIADTDNHRMLKYDSTGNFITKWGTEGTGDGQLDSPEAVYVDSDRKVYVADTSNNRVQIYSLYGFARKWGIAGTGNGEFDLPYGVASDSEGNVYVADTYNNRVQKFDFYGNYLGKWGTGGSEDGQFNTPRGVAVDSSDKIYISDTYNNRLQQFDSNGNFLGKWGTAGTSEGDFYTPKDIAIDSNDNIYVADADNHRVQKFDSSGIFVTMWGSSYGNPGTGPGEFNGPNTIAVDSQDNIYVTDWGNYRVQKFNSDGTYITEWGGQGSGNGEFEGPIGICVNNADYVFVADMVNSNVQKFDSNGTHILTVISLGTDDGLVNMPAGIDSSRLFNGWIYVADTGNNRIQRFFYPE